MKTENTCAHCDHWGSEMADRNFGTCRAAPPEMGRELETNPSSPSPNSTIQLGEWPWTEGCDWCGDFKPKDAP